MLFNFGFIDSKVSLRCIFGLSIGYFYYFLKFFKLLHVCHHRWNHYDVEEAGSQIGARIRDSV